MMTMIRNEDYNDVVVRSNKDERCNYSEKHLQFPNHILPNRDSITMRQNLTKNVSFDRGSCYFTSSSSSSSMSSSTSKSLLNIKCILEILPIELIQYEILYPYCDGKSLSTFAYVLISLTDVPYHTTNKMSRKWLRGGVSSSHPSSHKNNNGRKKSHDHAEEKNKNKVDGKLCRIMNRLRFSTTKNSVPNDLVRNDNRNTTKGLIKQREENRMASSARQNVMMESLNDNCGGYVRKNRQTSFDMKERYSMIVWEMIPQIGRQRLNHLADMMEKSVRHSNRLRDNQQQQQSGSGSSIGTSSSGSSSISSDDGNGVNSNNITTNNHIDSIQQSYALNAIAWIRSIAKSIHMMVILPDGSNTNYDNIDNIVNSSNNIFGSSVHETSHRTSSSVPISRFSSLFRRSSGSNVTATAVARNNIWTKKIKIPNGGSYSYHNRIRIMNHYCHYIQKLSHFMALMDFLECCIYQYSNIDEGQYNWEMVCHCLRAYNSCCHHHHNKQQNQNHNNHRFNNIRS